jgi:predicted pyridoxine 5'-phosphate oxidase superfamily flavin-nucleotide-binding protein
MATFYPQLTPELRRFIAKQPMFFVATAAPGGRINLSPKGMDTFAVLDDRTVGYVDITGSGNETAAHIEHDGRLTIMFCSFGAKPMILRLYGRGEVVPADAPRRAELAESLKPQPGERQVILLHVDSLQTSCGWGVPRMEQIAARTKLTEWATRKGPAGVKAYQRKHNGTSIDGLSITRRASVD